MIANAAWQLSWWNTTTEPECPRACDLLKRSTGLKTSVLLLQSSSWLLQIVKSWAVDLVKPKKKKIILPENQCGLRGNRTWHRMKSVWVWFHASRGEGSYSLFPHGTWDISCASNMSQPKARKLGIHSPTSTSHSSFNFTQLVSLSSCIRSSKDKWKVTQEPKDTKAQENETSYHVLISALTLPFPASYLEYCLSKEPHGSLQVTFFFP